MKHGPVKPSVDRRFKADDAKQDPKRSDSAKRETLERKRTRRLKRVSRPGTAPGNQA